MGNTETRTAEEIAAAWNPPSEDQGIVLAVGEPVPEGWGLATNASSNGLTEDGAVPVDKGGDDSVKEFVPYRKRNKSELQDEARERGLPVSGSKDDLIERLVDHDVNGSEDDGDDDEEEDDGDEE